MHLVHIVEEGGLAWLMVHEICFFSWPRLEIWHKENWSLTNLIPDPLEPMQTDNVMIVALECFSLEIGWDEW